LGRAVGRTPSLGKPNGCILERRDISRQDALAIPSDPSQHRVRESGEVPELRVAAGELDTKINGRVVRHVQKQDLRGARREKRESALVGGEALGQPLVQDPPERAKAPKCRDCDCARQRIGTGVARENLVQARACPEHLGHAGLRDPARLEPGRLRAGRLLLRPRPARFTCCMRCSFRFLPRPS
jgi:hypothetical protein